VRHGMGASLGLSYWACSLASRACSVAWSAWREVHAGWECRACSVKSPKRRGAASGMPPSIPGMPGMHGIPAFYPSRPACLDALHAPAWYAGDVSMPEWVPNMPKILRMPACPSWAGASMARALQEQARAGASRREQGYVMARGGASRVYWLREQGGSRRERARAGAGRTSQSASRADQLFERGADSGGGRANRPT
jgi:hypothetical protein